MNINELSTPAGVQSFIESQISPDVDQEIERRRMAYQAAKVAHEAAQQRLADHEATSPEADPGAWAAQRRTLADVVPVFAEIRTKRGTELQEAAGTKVRIIFDTLGQLESEAGSAAKQAQIELQRQIDELEAQIDRLKREGLPEAHTADAMFGAVHTVRNDYRQLYTNHPDLSFN